MEITLLASRLGEALLEKNWMLSCAESCTGGGIAAAITAISGSSQWFDRGFVTYSNLAKSEMLGVAESTLEKHGAVSEAVVKEMAAGALSQSQASLAVAVSGIAGPTGGTKDKPVGTVYIAWQVKDKDPVVSKELFSGDRDAVREQTVLSALQGLLSAVG